MKTGGGMNKIIMELKWSYGKCLWRWSEGGGRNFEFMHSNPIGTARALQISC